MIQEGEIMSGKKKCMILKEIRQRIADENDIPYVTRECSYQGECAGTCPRCESELRYLEQQLAIRQTLGKRITVAALCAGMAFGTAGCRTIIGQKDTDLGGAVPYEDPVPTPEPEVFVTTGEVAWPEEIEDEGDPNEEPESLPPENNVEESVEWELMGDVAYFPDGEDNG